MPADAAPPLCLSPLAPSPRAGFRLPAGSTDTHIHVFGPPARYSLVARRDYTPVEASLADYRHVMAAYGIERAVLVQPSVYGTDNSLILDTLAQDPEHFRAVAVIPPDLDDQHLAELDRARVRGVRVNRRNPGGLPLSSVEALGRRIAPFGWHIQLHVGPEELPEVAALAPRSAVPLVIDHFGLVSPAAGDPAAGALLRLVEAGVYVKLSAPYRIAAAGSELETFRDLVDKLVAVGPDRLLWGTDWPHVACWPMMPDDGELAALTEAWLPDPAIRTQVLVTNPDRLYWAT